MATKHYYVNPTPQALSGDNEVHVEDCHWLTLVENPVPLGKHEDCKPAVDAAKLIYPDTADGCKHCSLACHGS